MHSVPPPYWQLSVQVSLDKGEGWGVGGAGEEKGDEMTERLYNTQCVLQIW